MRLSMHRLCKFLLVALISVHCSETEEPRGFTSGASNNEAYTSNSIAAESTMISVSDAMDSLTDTNTFSSSGGNLFLTAAKDLTFEKQKNCETADNNAVVNINVTISGESLITRKSNEFQKNIEGNRKTVRTWSWENQEVPCSADSKHASIDWSATDLEGLRTSITTTKTRNTTVNKNGDYFRKVTRKVEATRSVTWLSHVNNGDGTFTRTKSITNQVTRTRDVSKKGKDFSLKYAIATKEDAPLAISVTRNTADRKLVSKKVTAGSLIFGNSNSDYVLSEFSNLTINFSADSCIVNSGKVTSSFFKEGETEPVKKIELTASNGIYEVLDITDIENPVIIEDLDYESCNIKSFK